MQDLKPLGRLYELLDRARNMALDRAPWRLDRAPWLAAVRDALQAATTGRYSAAV